MMSVQEKGEGRAVPFVYLPRLRWGRSLTTVYGGETAEGVRPCPITLPQKMPTIDQWKSSNLRWAIMSRKIIAATFLGFDDYLDQTD